MTIIEANIEIVVGSAFNAQIDCYEDEAETLPFDFTNYAGQAGVFDKFGEGRDKLCDIAVYFNDIPDDGALKFSMTKAETLLLAGKEGDYVWDALLWPTALSEEETWVRGVAHILPQGTVRS